MDHREKTSDSDYYSKAVTIILLVVASLVGFVVLIFSGTGTIR